MQSSLPQVGKTLYVKEEFDLPIISGSKAKTAHMDKDFMLQIVANGETGPLLKIMNPLFLTAPVSQFTDRLTLGITFKDLITMQKAGLLR